MSRLSKLAARLDADPLLVTYGANVRYLTGFESSNTALLLEPSGEATLFSDFRYAEAARAIEGVAFVETARDVVSALAHRLAGRRIGFEAARISYAHWETLTAGEVDLVATRGLVEALRAVKDANELAIMRRAAALSDAVYEALREEQFSGRTEAELAWIVERTFRELGAERLSFETIVSSGPRGARPHHHPGADLIPGGTLVTVDIGCVLDGYCSDCTRTFATGELTPPLTDVYEAVARAQLDGLAAVRAGRRGSDVDADSRVAIAQAGYGSAYGHGLGHGVGIEIHEAPTLRPESEDVLAAGNVVSVEPGVYLPGVGGCRIEDLVVVTESGCELLTGFTKELVVVA